MESIQIHGALLRTAPPPPRHGPFRQRIPASSCKFSFGMFTTARTKPASILRCKGIQVSDLKEQQSSSSSSSIGCVNNGISRSVGVKEVDVATLGNLCVDIVLNVRTLPPASLEERKEYMEQLAASPPDKKNWEAGGNCNMAIAASRLGLSCITIGHVGKEIYGNFLVDVLQNENVGMVGMDKEESVTNSFSASRETLLCWVLVDPSQRHGFCSRADFCQDPAFNWMTELSPEVLIAIKQSKTLFCNGYGFDDFSPSLLTAALNYAVEVGTSIFFDPGPRGRSLSVGSRDEQKALDLFLRMSDVLLLTSDEAHSLTGIRDPIQAGKEMLRNGVRTKWVIIKMGPRGSILITTSSISCAPAFKVQVCDTVGCGDSFVAAVAYGYIHKLSKIDTLTLANSVGAATAMGSGAGRNVATMEKVLDLMKASSLNEDDAFWNSLLDEYLDTQECSILYTATDNSRRLDKSHHISMQKVVSELMPKLKSFESQQCVPSKYMSGR